MQASGILPMSGDDEVGQHVNLNNITGPQESNIDIIYVLGNDGMGLDMHTRKEDNKTQI